MAQLLVEIMAANILPGNARGMAGKMRLFFLALLDNCFGPGWANQSVIGKQTVLTGRFVNFYILFYHLI